MKKEIIEDAVKYLRGHNGVTVKGIRAKYGLNQREWETARQIATMHNIEQKKIGHPPVTDKEFMGLKMNHTWRYIRPDGYDQYIAVLATSR